VKAEPGFSPLIFGICAEKFPAEQQIFYRAKGIAPQGGTQQK
jgi:hypothetical protein